MTQMFVLMFLLLSFLRAESATYINDVCVDCASSILVPAGGSTTAAPLLRQLSFSFKLVEPTIQVNFVSQNLDTAMDQLQTACRKSYKLDFAALDYPLQAWEAENPLQSKDLESVPVVATAVVMAYNFPGLTTDVDPDLILSRQNMFDIFYGNITEWNDPRIVENNPLLADYLPNKTISLVLRTDPSGTAGTIMTLLAHFDDNFDTSSFTTWPKRFLTLPNAILAQGSNGVIAAIISNPYSIGVVAQAYVEEAGLPAAQLQNLNGDIVAATGVGVYDAVVAAQNADHAFGDFLNPADMNGTNAYPLAQLIHLVYHTEVDSECDSRIAMAKFLNWMLTSDDSVTQIFNYPGFVPLPTYMVNDVLASIQSLSCNGENLLQETFVDFGGNAMTQTITIFAAVLIVISVTILTTLSYKRNNRITRAAGLAFAFFFLLGCIFNYLSVIFWATVPSDTSICIGRYAFVTLGYSLILGAMFAKCWEISKIFYRAEKGDISPFKELPWWMFCRAFFAVVFAEALFLLIWLVVDPPVSTTLIIDDVNILAIHQCTTNYPAIWYSLHFIYFGVVLVWGAYLAYLTRNIWQKYNYPNESRSILLSIYNLGFCAVILVPLVTALDASTGVLFFLISVAIIFPTTFALIVVHGPKMLAFLATSISKGSRGSKGDKGSSAPHQGTKGDGRDMSHTVRILKAEPEKERSLVGIDDASERPIPLLTPDHPHSFPNAVSQDDMRNEDKSNEGIELVSLRTTVPTLGATWKVLTPNKDHDPRRASPSAFDTPEVVNPLFGENI